MSTELDLDDVAAQSPKAKAELGHLRALFQEYFEKSERLERELNLALGLLRDDADKDSAEVAALRYYAAIRGPQGEPARAALASHDATKGRTTGETK